MDRFRTTFTLMDNAHPQRNRTVRTEDAIVAVEQSNVDVKSISLYVLPALIQSSPTFHLTLTHLLDQCDVHIFY